MPRFIVERLIPDGLRIPLNDEGEQALGSVMRNNASRGVFWLHSYVSKDLRKTFCVYDGPSPEAIREVAAMSNLPVSDITQVNVLDPHFYRG